MVAYIDLIILENFLMNSIILYTTGKLLNKKIYIRRIFFTSIIGTMYVFSLCLRLTNFVLNISKLVTGIMLVKICFRSKNVRSIIKDTMVYFFTSFVYAGCALGFLHIIKPKVVYIVNGMIIGGEYIFETVGISAIISFFIIKTSINLIKLKQHFSRKNMICNIEIFFRKRSIKLKALLDTGNLLKDPITSAPVVIVYKEKVKALFNNSNLDQIDSMIGGDGFNNIILNDKCIRIIPYTSVGNINGVMIACKVDKIKVEYQDEVNEINDVLIGLYNEALSKNDKYSALIGLQILEGSKINNEHISNVKSKSKYSVC
ncbi:MAG: sigma-E processing peptidase SpoIIGA [Clostridia bacterium]|nr:sigma-E processing peptidase SpoIIGA [Clostridia bacterium]